MVVAPEEIPAVNVTVAVQFTVQDASQWVIDVVVPHALVIVTIPMVTAIPVI